MLVAVRSSKQFEFSHCCVETLNWVSSKAIGSNLWFNKADFVLYSSLMFYGSPRGLNCHELKYKVVFHLHVRRSTYNCHKLRRIVSQACQFCLFVVMHTNLWYPDLYAPSVITKYYLHSMECMIGNHNKYSGTQILPHV